MSEAPLIDSFAEIEDSRCARNTLYPIEEILLLSICGAISGADDFVALEEFGESKLDWLRGFLPFKRGVPSHDTLGRVFGQIESSAFERCFRSWTRRVQEKTDEEVVAIDGKTACGSGDRASGTDQLHLVEAWATEQELMLGQRRSEDGANEIEAIPQLLEVLALEGCNAWIDAMGCQTSVAKAIVDAKADYVLRVKDNQESLRSDIERLFERRLDRDFKPGYTDVDGGHGRVETRRCWAIDVEGRGLVDESRWPELQSVALVETERFVAEPQEEAGPVDGETETKRRYLISSLDSSPAGRPTPRRSLRPPASTGKSKTDCTGFWASPFKEDHSQVRTRNAAENLALVRRLAASAVKQDEKVDAGTQTKRMRAGWDDDYREHLLQEF